MKSTTRTLAPLAAVLFSAAPAAAQPSTPDWDFWAREKLVAVDPSMEAAASFDPNRLRVRGCERLSDGLGCPATYPVASADACRFAAVATHVTNVISARDLGEASSVTTELDCLGHRTRVTTGAHSVAVLLEQWEHGSAAGAPVARVEL